MELSYDDFKAYRDSLINELEILGLRIDKPYEMATIELEALVDCHYKGSGDE